MKPRVHIGWAVFAIAMVWGEAISDVPRLVLPHRTTWAHLFIAIMNVIAATGLTSYAFRWTRWRRFWRAFAPLYALFMAYQIGTGLPLFTRGVLGLLALGKSAPLLYVGALTVLIPILAMIGFTLLALFRAGDWAGPGRRPFEWRPSQLSLPL